MFQVSWVVQYRYINMDWISTALLWMPTFYYGILERNYREYAFIEKKFPFELNTIYLQHGPFQWSPDKALLRNSLTALYV